ncbi:MAG: alpha/beta hydrolase [Anaerolineae bacterium]|nr:alpha/beta hydrolase [Anaerolineae bacterium]
MTAVLRLLAAIVFVVLLIPVLLLLLGTGVPLWAITLMTLADLALLILAFKFKWTLKGVAVMLGGALLVAAAAVALSQVLALTPPITDAQGNPLPNSIALLEKVNLNDSEQWITIRGKDVSKPILLYLGLGGPGAGGFAMRPLFEPLEEHFVVVSWDEPGTGKSYSAVPIKSLTPQQFVDDAYALTQMLCQRFDKQKVYVYGVSWTSIVGIWLVQQHPDLYYAYIGNGQMINTTENDVMGYEFAIQYLTERGDTAGVEQLRRNGPPPYVGDGLALKYVAYLDVLNEYMGTLPYSVVVPLIPMFSPEYGLIDKVNHFRGLYESFEAVYPQLSDLDFTTQAAKLDVPVYIFAGRNDVNAMTSLVEEYFNVLQAPHKELIWFENGGHGLEEGTMAQFTDVMVNEVLKYSQQN